jgi:formate hydrogenlyase transcriptional activator
VASAFFRQTASWIDGAKEKCVLNSTASQPVAIRWLAENGPKELELLLRAVIFHPSTPILIADNDRRYREASVGASKLLGLPREKIIGRSLDEFAVPEIRPVISERWRTFLEEGEQVGTLQLLGPDGTPRDVEYVAKGNVLPVRHLLALRDKSAAAVPDADPAQNSIPSWVQDFALSLLDVDGQIVAWYGGSERIYQYTSNEAVGQNATLLNPDEDPLQVTMKEELKRAASEGHFGAEGWHVKKNGIRFWANVITMALRSESGDLQGYARVVRDFSVTNAMRSCGAAGSASARCRLSRPS